jgi:hypothetical protein
MIAKQSRIQPLLGSKNMSVSDRASGEVVHHSSSGAFSWYLAQRALPELKYVATVNGYVILP